MDTFQTLGTPNRSRFGVFKLSKPKRLKARHGLPDKIGEGAYVYRAVMPLDVDGNWGTWLGEQRDAAGARRPVLLKHTGEENRTHAGADALWLEALLALKLNGPQVAALLDYGVLDGRPFAVYDLVDGVSLSQVLDSLKATERRLPAGVAVAIVLQACEIIGKLHRVAVEDEQQSTNGFVHGSLCPRNFVLTTRGDVKVMGLVGARPLGRTVGRQQVPEAALRYASPQLLEGEPVGPVVDVHALGAVLLEMLGSTSDASAEPRSADLGDLLRQQLRASPTGGTKSIEAFAELLQDAVRRTGTVVARQSIGAQVREACEQELIERRKLIRAQLETAWDDESNGVAAAVAAGNGASNGAAVRTAVTEPGHARGAASEVAEELTGEALADGEDSEPQLAQYDEATSDDAVTRIYQGPEIEAEAASEAAAPPAWMESRPPERAKASWSRWAIGIAIGMVVAVSSVAAFVASRSPSAGSEKVAAAEQAKAGTLQRGPTNAAPAAKTSPAQTQAASVDAKPAMQPGATAAVADVVSATDDDEAEAEDVPGEARQAKAGSWRSKARARAAARARARAAKARGTTATASRAEENVEVEEPATAEPEATEPGAGVAANAPAATGNGTAEAAKDDLEIEDQAAVSFLTVDATPYATIYIDGEKKGVTPIVSLKLAAGPHRMIAKTEDGRIKRFSLLLEPGKTDVHKLTWDE
jgi:hypothetical protein